MAAWPASLPQVALADGFSESAAPNTIRTEMDVGSAKVRRRYTAEIKTYGIALLLTTAQVTTLETFYVATLESGTLTFDWKNQRTKAAATYRFLSRPAYEEIGAGYWRTQLALEAIP